jgi:hypothetical protein
MKNKKYICYFGLLLLRPTTNTSRQGGITHGREGELGAPEIVSIRNSHDFC